MWRQQVEQVSVPHGAPGLCVAADGGITANGATFPRLILDWSSIRRAGDLMMHAAAWPARAVPGDTEPGSTPATQCCQEDSPVRLWVWRARSGARGDAGTCWHSPAAGG